MRKKSQVTGGNKGGKPQLWMERPRPCLPWPVGGRLGCPGLGPLRPAPPVLGEAGSQARPHPTPQSRLPCMTGARLALSPSRPARPGHPTTLSVQQLCPSTQHRAPEFPVAAVSCPRSQQDTNRHTVHSVGATWVCAPLHEPGHLAGAPQDNRMSERDKCP